MIAKCGEWITDRDPTEEEVNRAGDTGFILCISGQKKKINYDHAVIMDEFNEFYNGKWCLGGLVVNNIDNFVLHGWMMPPEPI